MPETKIRPHTGMPVEWINPTDDSSNKLFIEQYIRRYGQVGLQVQTSNPRPGNQVFVTLTQNGKVLIDDQRNPLYINWNFLRPLQ